MKKILALLLPLAMMACLTYLVAHGQLPPSVLMSFLGGFALPSPAEHLRHLRGRRQATLELVAEPQPALPPPVPQDTPRAEPAERAALRELVRHVQAEDNAPVEARPLAKVGRQRAAAAAAELLRALCLMFAILTPVLAIPGCVALNGYLKSLANCGVQIAPAGVQAGVALALSRGDGWEAALATMLSTYGQCLVKAEVARHAAGEGPEPPHIQAAALATLLPPDLSGELGAGPPAVSKEERAARARAWLAGRR